MAGPKQIKIVISQITMPRRTNNVQNLKTYHNGTPKKTTNVAKWTHESQGMDKSEPFTMSTGKIAEVKTVKLKLLPTPAAPTELLPWQLIRYKHRHVMYGVEKTGGNGFMCGGLIFAMLGVEGTEICTFHPSEKPQIRQLRWPLPLGGNSKSYRAASTTIGHCLHIDVAMGFALR